MLGVVVTALFSLLAAVAGQTLIKEWSVSLDPAERLGLGGLVGLGAVGLLTLLLGLLPGSLLPGTFRGPGLLVALIVGGFLLISRNKGALKQFKFAWPRGAQQLAFAAVVLIGLLALVAVLAPSIATDWDTIAYHLAVPKLWIEHGQVTYIQGIHHSNFPSTMEMLFLWGLKWGGQSGAKAFSLAVYAFGSLALFGLARRWYGGSAGWWAALGFAGIPVVAWESGTGYIDVAHGLYAGLGALYAVEAFRKDAENAKSLLVLSGICLGFAMGTKYTGLQTLFAVVAVVGFASIFLKGFKQTVVNKLTVALIALVIAAPWYVKTYVYTGNPVYPFFHSVLGGKDWDAWRASIYTAEQKSFGVGTDPLKFGHAVLGLAYQPGRYTNPGPHENQGFPTGAIGFAALLAGVCAATCGRLRREERLVLAVVGLGFLMWFFLSQQSRYLTMLAVPLVALGAGQVTRVRWGPVVAAGFALQAVVTVYLINRLQTSIQLPVALGQVSREDYLSRYLPFYRDAQVINDLGAGTRVALYDEVFGFYLDVPYFWANPGHSMHIPYEGMVTGADLVSGLREKGFTHVYLGQFGADPRFAAAVTGERPYTEEEWAQKYEDLNTRWHLLVADAAQRGLLAEVGLPTRNRLYALR